MDHREGPGDTRRTPARKIALVVIGAFVAAILAVSLVGLIDTGTEIAPTTEETKGPPGTAIPDSPTAPSPSETGSTGNATNPTATSP